MEHPKDKSAGSYMYGPRAQAVDRRGGLGKGHHA